MYLFIKKVKENYYYWNQVDKTWEGLKNNATLLTKIQINIFLKQVSKLINKNDFSFIKHTQ